MLVLGSTNRQIMYSTNTLLPFFDKQRGLKTFKNLLLRKMCEFKEGGAGKCRILCKKNSVTYNN